MTWIRSDTDRPEDGAYVLVVNPYGFLAVASYDEPVGLFRGFDGNPIDATHWLRIPAIPIPK